MRSAKLTKILICAAAFVPLLTAQKAKATDFTTTNLVSNGSVPAATVDHNLINPWGISYAPTGPFWVSDNGTGLTTLYTGTGAIVPLVVTIGPSGSPVTGQVFNSSASGFQVTSGGITGKSAFIFDGENGTISGWAPSVNGNHSIVAVDNSASGAVYKGLAIGQTGSDTFLYAANFSSGEIEQYNSSFGLVKDFTDPNVAAGYAPFNTQVLDNNLFVTFAKQNAAKTDDIRGEGNGFVDEFSLDGTFEKRIVSAGGAVDSPWGLAIGPSSFGSLANDLLVGNFGDGTISAFDPTTDAFEGKLLGPDGKPLVETDLWALIVGNGASGGDANKIYFTAGLSHEAGGLLGSIAPSPVPLPAGWTLMVSAMGVIGCLRSRFSSRV